MNKQILKQQDKIRAAEQEIERLRSLCKHSKVEFKFHAERGNYDPSINSTRAVITCDDCGKRSSYDSVVNREEYRYWVSRWQEIGY